MTPSKGALAVPLYAETEEEQVKLQELQSARQKLQEALEGRNRLFDPVMLAMAQGFLAPTATGSFGESIASAAKAVLPVQEAEDKRGREIAQMRAELAAMELAGVQSAQAEKLYREALGLTPTKPAKPEGVAPSDGSPIVGAPLAPRPQEQKQPEGRPITEEDVKKLMPRAPDKAKQLLELIKLDRDRFEISMNGQVFDKKTQQYVDQPIPGQTQTLTDTPYGEFKMLPWQHSQYLNIRAKEGEEAGKAYLENVLGRKLPERIGVQTEPERIGTRVGAEAAAKSQQERFEDRVNRGASAGTRIAQLDSVRQIASRPDASKIMGVFEGPGVGDALGKLLETSGKGLPGVPEIRAIFTDLGLDKTLKSDQQLAAQLFAQINLELRKITRTPGEGNLSDFESRMILASGLDTNNTPQGLIKKIDFLKARAEYDREISRALRASGQKVDDFMDSEAAQNISSRYTRKLMGIVGASPTGSAASQAPMGRSGAGDRVRDALGVR